MPTPDSPAATLARSELILGGQKSGKSRRAESLARAWLDGAPGRRGVLVATAVAGDDEMGARIGRHRADRARRVPALATVEEPQRLAQTIRAHSDADTLVVVDCLVLWLANRLMPAGEAIGNPAGGAIDDAIDDAIDGTADGTTDHAIDELADAVRAARGPLVLVSNEIGLGVIPLGREVRAFVDALGCLNQAMAQACERVTLMAAGLPLALKEPA